MSIDKLIATVNKYEKGLPKAVELSTRTVMSKMVKRIFTAGVNSVAGKIGDYSTKPLYVSNDKAPKGKQGKGRNKTYFAGGWKEFKKKQVGTSRVNFRLFGDLMRDFAGGTTNPEAANPKTRPTRLGATSYGVVLKKDINILKREGLEQKFGTTFNATRGEERLFSKVLLFELKKLL